VAGKLKEIPTLADYRRGGRHKSDSRDREEKNRPPQPQARCDEGRLDALETITVSDCFCRETCATRKLRSRK